MVFRCRALLDLAKEAPRCMALSCHKRNEGDIVAAHSNQGRDGKGMGIKASDGAIAFLCSRCHGFVDQGPGDIEKRLALWEAAHRATMRWLVETGRLVVRPADYIPPPEPVKSKRKVRSGAKITSRGFQKLDTPRKIPSRPFPSRKTKD